LPHGSSWTWTSTPCRPTPPSNRWRNTTFPAAAAARGILVFLARDAEQRVFRYANAGIPKAEQSDEILRFIEFWERHTGQLPEELIFDSQLTTHENLSKLNQQGIGFITLRRRSRKMLGRSTAVRRRIGSASRWTR